MHESRSGPVVRWRRPAKSGARTPHVILLHGSGADEDDLFSLADALPSELVYASIRGFVPLPAGGNHWFESRAIGRPIAKSLRASLGALRAWFDDPAVFDKPRRRSICSASARG